jgi:hypothetical protein
MVRLFYFGLPALLLVTVLTALNAGPILKRPMGAGEDVGGRLQAVANLAAAGEWSGAERAVTELDTAWKSVHRRVHFVSGEGEMREIQLALADLKGAVEGHDPLAVRQAYRRLNSLWDHLAR